MRNSIIAIALGTITILIGMIVVDIQDDESARQLDPLYSCTVTAHATNGTSKATTGDTFRSLKACTTASGWVAADIESLTAADADATAALLATALDLGSGKANGASATGDRAAIYQFSGAPDIQSLTPLVLRVVLLLAGISMIGLGAAGTMGYGPVSRM